MIEVKNLSKSYGKTIVLEDVSLQIEDNKIYGLLGRNGIGKTTLLNIITNQIRANKGSITLDGKEIFENSNLVSQLSIIKEKGIEVPDIKVKEIFETASILYKDWDEKYKTYLIEEFNLNTKKKFNKLSRGNQTIVGLITGLASRARFTIFDEPSLGLDAAHRDRFYNLILEDFDKNPRTIIISTHLIDEVSNVFEDIIILKDNNVLLQEEVASLMEKAFYLSGREEAILSIINKNKIIHREEFGQTVVLAIFDDLSNDTKEKLKTNNIEISSIPLQKLFIYLTENSYIKEAI